MYTNKHSGKKECIYIHIHIHIHIHVHIHVHIHIHIHIYNQIHIHSHFISKRLRAQVQQIYNSRGPRSVPCGALAAEDIVSDLIMY